MSTDHSGLFLCSGYLPGWQEYSFWNRGGHHLPARAAALPGDDYVLAGAGSDAISGGAGADNLSGGGGYDYLDYGDSAAGVSVNLGTNSASGGDATGDTISGCEAVLGSANNDALVGSSGGDILSGDAGNDTIFGRDGSDPFFGGEGADSIDGGTGDDCILGDGLWVNTMSYKAVDGAFTNLTVTNSADAPVDLHWIDGSGQ